MKRWLFAAVVLTLSYLLLAEVAWNADFMAALAGVRRGRPLLALGEVVFFGLRVLLVVGGPPLVMAWIVSRLTKSWFRRILSP